MHQCAEAGFKNLSFAETCLDRGVVDYGSDDFKTPSDCAVLSRCFMLAGFLHDRSSNFNAYFTGSLIQRSTYPTTVLRMHVEEVSEGSMSCINFLVCKKLTWAALNLVVLPWTLHYFQPSGEDLHCQAATTGTASMADAGEARPYI